MIQKLPVTGRPRLENYRRCDVGLDVTSAFFYDMKAIDSEFYLIWHPYTTTWDDIVNEGLGTDEDPRYPIQEQFGQLCFGYVLKQPDGRTPHPDNTWHIWRYAWPHGWAHICQLKSTHPEYLDIILKSLYLQKQMLNKYGPKAFGHHQINEQEKQKQAHVKEKEELHKLWQLENKWLLRRAMENAHRGFTQATDPKKDMIMSGPGLSYRSRITTDITEKEGGIYNPDED